MYYLSLVILFSIFMLENALAEDTFLEELYIKPLPSGHIYSHFQFTTLVDKSLEKRTQWRHSHLFPVSLGETLTSNYVAELHLSLSQGLWRYSSWGFPTRPSPPGAQLSVWFQENTPNVESSWKELVNSLSGQFCTSMNFADGGNTVEPFLSFVAEGAVNPKLSSNTSLHKFAALPKESVCTENLTPLKKLLPCDTKGGLSQLLNAVNVLSSSYFALAVDIRSVCKTTSCLETYVELRETVSVVFDPITNQNVKQDWSLIKMFGISINKPCPAAKRSTIFVDVSSNNTDHPFSLIPDPSERLVHAGGKALAVYDVFDFLSKSTNLNIKSVYKKGHVHWIHRPPSLHADRYVTGYGLEWGGIQCDIQNTLKKELRIVYFDVLPWFLKVYAHTMRVAINGILKEPEWLQFRPGQDRKRPHHLEMVLLLPPKSQTQISFQFQRAFLKWTEYPPDANHGFYVQSAVITTLLPISEPNGTFLHRSANTLWNSFSKKEDEEVMIPLYTGSLLVTLPTPDFSMPYNCICLTCTVVALAFGPIHNLTTKRLCKIEDGQKKKTLFEKITGIFKKSKSEDLSENKKSD